MKIFLHSITEDKFTNPDTGEIIDYANAHIYEEDRMDTPTLKGRRVVKVRTKKGVIHSVDAKTVPGYFEAEIGFATSGKIIINRLEPIKG